MNEINEDEVFEKKESKIKPTLKKILAHKKIVAGVIIAVILVCLVAMELTTGSISNLFYFNAGMGNSAGNITNCGYSVAKGDTIYYVAPSENMEHTNIYKVKKGSSDFEKIFEGGYDVRALNVIGNHLYFINIISDENQEDAIDNKIYKMNLDGSKTTVINDNEFACDYYAMYAVNNQIYYVGTDYNVYKMDLNGGNRKLVAETGTGFLAVNEKYILYDKPNEDSTNYITYIKELGGTEEREVNGTRIFTPILQGDMIYYINQNEVLAKMPITGGDEEIMLDHTIYNLNLANDTIYYIDLKNSENAEEYAFSIYKLGLDGGEPEIVKDFAYYSSFLNIVDGYAYYMDMDEEKAFVNLVNLNDDNEIKLYEWEYEEHSHEE